MKYWLLKSEPDAWSWDNQVKEGASMWDGVRNYQARNNLKGMKKGDATSIAIMLLPSGSLDIKGSAN